MPTYEVTDPQSGRTIELTGDSPPTEQELNEIFSTVGGSPSNQNNPGLLSKIGSATEAVGNFFLPDTTQAIKGAATGTPLDSPKPMSNVEKGIGFTLGVLPGGAGAREVFNQPTPLGAAARELGSNVVAGEVIGTGFNALKGAAKPVLQGIANSKIGRVGSDIAKKAVSKVANISAKEFADFESSTGGKNIVDTMYKYLQKVSPKDDDALRALYGKAGKGGIFEADMKTAEKVIQSRVKKEGSTVIADVDEVLAPVDELLNKISKPTVDEAGNMVRNPLPGQEAVYEGLEKFAAAIRQTYKESGFTADEILRIKRAGDSNLGASVMTEDKGAAITRAKKIVTNKAREILKNKFPDIADALNTEQEILELEPIVRDQIARKAVDKDFIPKAYSGVDVSRPGTLLRPITENDWVLRKMSEGKFPVPGLDLTTNVMTNPIIQRGLITPQVVNQTPKDDRGGGSPGLNLKSEHYLYR